MKYKGCLAFKLPVKITKRAKWYLASCPILDVHSQGKTKELAKRNLIEALSLFFITSLERGNLDNVLAECGFTPTGDGEIPSFPAKDYIDVPIHLLYHARKARPECRE